jgi:xylulokinase
MGRAVLEGISMSLKDCFELGREFGLAPQRILLSGGGARSDTWRQMIADIFEVEVSRIEVDEGPAYGAAILAAVGAGFYSSVEGACKELISIADSKLPDPAAAEVYRGLYELYRPLYTTLKDHSARSAAFIQKQGH